MTGMPPRRFPTGATLAVACRWMTLVFLALALALPSCGKREESAESETKTEDQEKAPGDTVQSVELSAEAVKLAEITVGRAGSATIAIVIELPGEVKLDAERVLVLHPRFAGVVHQMRKRIGEAVSAGEVVATVQSNESLADYGITSSMTGQVVERGATPGEAVTPDASLYTIADLSRVWIEFAVYPHQLGAIRRGQAVRVTRTGGGEATNGTISYVGPVLKEDTRVSIARVVLPNPARRWEPGLFVTASVVTDEARVAVGIPDDAIVRMHDGSAVFLADGARFVLRPVVTGKSDGRTTEIVSGLAVGDPVVVHNAYVLKAELGKSEIEE
jgi:membrane fusion protein, heavy metal efflux system